MKTIMRNLLKEITEKDYWCYGVNESDFDYTFDLVEKFLSLSKREVEREAEEAKRKYPNPEIHGEIISDVAHYAWCEEQYLWQFCLWRIQGIFEALIMNTFISEELKRSLIGLRAKLEAVKNSGLRLEQKHYEELLSWGKVRNALSHAPPEQYRPGPLKKSDIQEYISLVKLVCAHWREQISMEG